MAKDFYHEIVRKALQAEGWKITHDPFPLNVGGIGYEVDLGAEKLIAAEKGSEKIAVELERVHIYQVKTSLKFFDKSEKKIRTHSQRLLIAS